MENLTVSLLPKLVSAFRRAVKDLATNSTIHQQAITENPWFTPFYIQSALQKLLPWLEIEQVNPFLKKYPLYSGTPKTVGLIMAGNLPLVGFQDLFHVLLAGHHAQVSPSSKDSVLITALIQHLQQIDPEIGKRITLQKTLGQVDFLLATGSNNTARQLSFSFQDTPKIIRKNRFSAAVLRGTESQEEINALAEDIFLYNGMGCRNVSLIFAPSGMKPESLLVQLDNYPETALSPPYLQLIQWEKARTSMLPESYYPGKWIIIQPVKQPQVPSVGMLNWVEYENEAKLESFIAGLEDQLQCVVNGKQGVEFGSTQIPSLDQFADGVDVIERLGRV